MEVFWLEQCQADVRRETDWLSAAELGRLAGMRIPKRLEDWLLGRWTAKQAVAAFFGLGCDPSTLANIQILPAESGAPRAHVESAPSPASISLTHRDGRAACAIAGGIGIGCDLEVIEPRCDAFASDYFTLQEQELVEQVSAANRFCLLALLWSAKESVLKALETGLRIDTRSVAVDFGPDYEHVGQIDQVLSLDSEPTTSLDLWYPFRAAMPREQSFKGWWQRSGKVIRTLVTVPSSFPPRFLKLEPILHSNR